MDKTDLQVPTYPCKGYYLNRIFATVQSFIVIKQQLKQCVATENSSMITIRLFRSLMVFGVLSLAAVPVAFGQQESSAVNQFNSSSPALNAELVVASYLSWFGQEISDQKLPGAALAIVSKDKVLDVHTWGVRSKQGNEIVDQDSLFRIASVSKTFAGTVASLVAGSGQQPLETPLRQILPQLVIGTKPSSQQITLKDVISHTTGLMPHAYSNMLDDGVAYEKIQEKFQQIPTVCSPGRCYGYQNVVFSLIADVVEVSTQKSYEDYLYEQLFVPLGMTSASTGLDKFESSNNATAPHRLVRGNWRVTSNNPAYYTVAPAAGINASILDMAIWARANLGAFPGVLDLDFLHNQHEPVVETPRGNYFNRWEGLEKAYYALGWRVFDYRGLRVIHHGGGVRGFRSEVAIVPEKNVAMVALFNAETRFANDIVPEFLDKLVD